MNNTERDQIIENDLGWAKKLKISEVGGRLMLGNEGTGQLPFDVAHIMKEEEFLKKWAIPFAVGNGLGINYFDRGEWFAFSYGGTRSVLVVGMNDSTGKWEPVLNIPPLVTVRLTAEDRKKLRLAAAVMHANNEDATKKNDINANLSVANTLSNERIGLEAPALAMSDLIDPAFFEKWFIVPEVEQATYWFRDVIRGGAKFVEPKVMERVHDILWRDHKGLQVTKDEYAFLMEESKGEFSMEGKVGVDYITDGGTEAAMKRGGAPFTKEEQGTPSKGQVQEKPESPFEC